ncbi:MAG TPA: PrgI family protein [bacterium]|jgi:hypothetical protein|nr:PrgI family protein [bacterium]
MLQFTVPQFIDIEDKIIGTVTVRQFVILLVATILVALCFKLLSFSVFVFMSLIILGSSITLAFVKINGAPFHYFILNIVQTFKKPRLRVWRKDDTLLGVIEFDTQTKKTPIVSNHPIYSASRLSELSLIVDTQGSYQGEGDDDTVVTRDRTSSTIN